MNNFRRRIGKSIKNRHVEILNITLIDYLPRNDMTLEFGSSTTSYRGAEKLTVNFDVYEKTTYTDGTTQTKYYDTRSADVHGMRAITINNTLNYITSDTKELTYTIGKWNDANLVVYVRYSVPIKRINKTDPDGTLIVVYYGLEAKTYPQSGYTMSYNIFKVTFTKQGDPGEGNVLVQFESLA